MGLLDGLVGSTLGGLLGGGGAGQQPGQSPSLLQTALQLLQQNGGLTGVLDRFKQAGLSQHVNSWVSTGPNMPVSEEQVGQALGPDVLNPLASKAGMEPGQLRQGLTQILPQLINQMTPNGQVPEDQHDLISQGLQSLLKGRPG